jgi:tetratricopeptide (TPR) repeat protein
MTRIVLIAMLAIMLNILAGCQTNDTGRGQLMPDRPNTSFSPIGTANVTDTTETDIIEQVAVNRREYRHGLEALVEHYTATGNSMKMDWAKKELAALNRMPQYKYVIEAEAASPNLSAKTPIPEADALYLEAVQLQKQAEQLVVIKDDDLLRLALDKYNRLIREYPSSDKIDDAAYKAGSIYEHFNDYTIALLYFQRAYQWDPATIHPARFRTAYLLDKRLNRKNEALELYKEAIQKESQHEQWREFAEKRVRQLTKTDEGIY